MVLLYNTKTQGESIMKKTKKLVVLLTMLMIARLVSGCKKQESVPATGNYPGAPAGLLGDEKGMAKKQMRGALNL